MVGESSNCEQVWTHTDESDDDDDDDDEVETSYMKQSTSAKSLFLFGCSFGPNVEQTVGRNVSSRHGLVRRLSRVT